MKYKKTSNAGFTLIELLIGLSILAIISSFIAPSFTNISAKNSLNSSVLTLVQVIKIAQKAAKSENTYVEVSINKNKIIMTKLNNNEKNTTSLSANVEANISLIFSINPTGHVVTGSRSLGFKTAIKDTRINLASTTNNSNRDIIISPTGYVSS